MVRREAPLTAEGWYALHDFRTIDWDDWEAAPQRVRERAIEEGRDHLAAATAVEDASAGDSAAYAILGHEADLMIVHLRPTTADLDVLERRFERTELARFTDRVDSFVSVTEASGYSERAREFLERELDEDSGLAKYMRSRIEPSIPDAEHVSFYPMNKRRDPAYNWYDLPFEERAEHMDAHGEIGREYAGKVTQMITGAIGIDDWEWGVTLWADDLTDVKELLYEMRFDPSTSKFAEFGPFRVGRRLAPTALSAYLAGEPIAAGDGEIEDAPPATPADAVAPSSEGQPTHPPAATSTADGPEGDHGHAEDGHPASGHPDDDADDESDGESPHGSTDANEDGGAGRPTPGDAEYATIDDLAERLFRIGLREGEDYEGGEYGLLFYSDANAQDLAEEVAGLRENFDHYDRHVATLVRASGGRSAVASLWTAAEAAETAAGFLGDLPGISERYGGSLDAEDDTGEAATDAADDATSIRAELAERGIYAGQPHGEDVYALVVYSTADPDDVDAALADVREDLTEADGHVETSVYESEVGDLTAVDAANATAVVSLWEREDGAEAAADALLDLPGVVGRADEADGFGTMGMFYRVKPDYREEFVETFAEVGDLLAGMDGHRGTALLANLEDETDMFIASNWDSREDAMAFFRSEDFRETVEWGREVLADQPRHVFLA